jgi:hypothetical protein
MSRPLDLPFLVTYELLPKSLFYHSPIWPFKSFVYSHMNYCQNLSFITFLHGHFNLSSTVTFFLPNQELPLSLDRCLEISLFSHNPVTFFFLSKSSLSLPRCLDLSLFLVVLYMNCTYGHFRSSLAQISAPDSLPNYLVE